MDDVTSVPLGSVWAIWVTPYAKEPTTAPLGLGFSVWVEPSLSVIERDPLPCGSTPFTEFPAISMMP